jgi:pyrimidine deaminase RibD-like protein
MYLLPTMYRALTCSQSHPEHLVEVSHAETVQLQQARWKMRGIFLFTFVKKSHFHCTDFQENIACSERLANDNCNKFNENTVCSERLVNNNCNKFNENTPCSERLVNNNCNKFSKKYCLFGETGK